MSDLHMRMPPPDDQIGGSRQYLEFYGSTAVMNHYLKIAVLALCAVCVGLTMLNLRTHRALAAVKPVVIRINEVGRAEAVAPANLEYRPQEAEIKYFLIQFVQQHHGRMRTTVKENYARSLYFLEGRLADAAMEADKKNKIIESVLMGQSDEIDIRVQNVSLEDLRQPPYRATVDYEKVYLGQSRQEVRREKYVGNFVFTVKERVPNALIPVNPLGLTITYFREDQAFQ